MTFYFTGAMTTLATELIPDADIDPVEPSVGYRKNVAMGFLYTVSNSEFHIVYVKSFVFIISKLT